MNFSFVSVRAFKALEPKATDFTFNKSQYNGVPTLTSLAFRYKGKTIELLECIITINQEKNIITTPMQGRDGTIKEYISDGDYSITVDAAVCSYDQQNWETSKAYPVEQIKELVEFLKIKDGLELQSDFLTLFDIKSVVVKSYGMLQETHSNRQSFQLQLLSDTPYEIKIKQDVNFNK